MADQGEQLWQDVARQVAGRGSVVIATIVRDEGSVPRRTGTKMLVFPDRSTRGTVGGGMFELIVIRDALAALKAGRCETRSYAFSPKGAAPDAFGAVCGGRAEVFLEVVMPRDRLLIVGGGHCGRALAQAASQLDLEIVVADDREEYVQPEHFPQGATLVHTTPDFANLPEPDAQTYVALVSKGFVTDEAALRRVIGSPAAYIGMMGSLNKRETVYANLRRDGVSEELIARVHCPIGLDIGADSPAEIAVCIVAEIIQTRAARRMRSIASDAAPSTPIVIPSSTP